MEKTSWLSRSLLLGPYLCLVTNQEEFLRAKKDMGVECGDPYVTPSAHATTHSYSNVKGNLACIVAVNLEYASGKDGIEIAGLLVHEAVHVWQQVRSTLTYTIDPSRTGGLEAEMEAYAIQNIAQNLLEAWAKISRAP